MLGIAEAWNEARRHWKVMNFYQRFEQLVALALVFAMSIVIVVALLELFGEIFRLLLNNQLDPLNHKIFQRVFGAIMTVLIALEFKHSILRVVAREDSIIQARTVMLIGLLALARKFIILDITVTSFETIISLAVATLVLGVVYWLIRDRDERARGRREPANKAGFG